MENILPTHTLFLAIFIVVFLWYLQFHLSRRRLYKIAKQYSGPRPIPIIGNVLKAVVPLTDITDHILAGCRYYKSPTRLWFGPYLTIQVWDPEDLRIILTSPNALAKQPFIYKLVENIAGHGLITSPVDEWRRHRRLISPIFNQKYLRSFFDIFGGHSKKLIRSVEGMADKGIFDAHDYLVKYAMDSVMDTILDFTEENGDTTETNEMIHCFHRIMAAYTQRMTTVWYFPDVIFNMSSVGKKMKRDKEKFDKFMTNLIKNWENDSMNRTSRSDDHTEETGFYKPMKLMDHLLSISDGGGKFTPDELRGEVNNLISAGFETTSSTIGFILILLGMYPEIQEKVFQEFTKVLGTRKELQYEDLKNLEYLDRVIKEGLRIYPGVVGIVRYNDQDIQLTNHVVPANTSILIPIVAVHRDPKIWPNPNKFDPDRFLPEEEAKRHPYSWIPFSAGPRNCVGLRFANMSLNVVLATFLLRYKVTTDYTSVENIPVAMMTVFKPVHGYKIGITCR